ncbi:MAG: helix-turn-helix transcriptional regulator [Deltaproteobacteria bacterium]|nr:helix-turn-helix transcriptional regulator [Deltaproteobacteria bacterium]
MEQLDTLGDRLRWARFTTKPALDDSAKPLSAREMSRRAGLSESMWGLLENGEKTEPSGATVDAIATLLDVPSGWVLARRGDDPAADHVRAAIERHAPVVEPEVVRPSQAA